MKLGDWILAIGVALLTVYLLGKSKAGQSAFAWAEVIGFHL